MAHPSSPQLVAVTPAPCVATPSSQDAEAAPSGVAPSVRQLGRYQLLQPIGAGGMGSVHLGLATGAAGFQRWIAIKRLNPRFAQDVSFARRFQVEARINAAVLHPNVVQVLDVAEEEGELLLVMEYVHGVTIAQLQRDLKKLGKRLPTMAAVGLMLPVLQGLQAVHEAHGQDGKPLRIVHRDVSPQNIMVDGAGHVRLLDFGVARATADTQATGLGMVAGKLSYLAPEQAQGRFDARSDLFAAGVVLWETLTGRRLFGNSGSEAATLQRTLWRHIPPPSQIQPDIPAALDRTVLRALCRNPEQRFQSARDFAAALETALEPASQHQLGGLVRFASEKRLRAKDALLEEARALTKDWRETSEACTLHDTGTPADAVVRSDESTQPSAGSSPRPRPPRRKVVSRSTVGAVGVAALCIGALGVWSMTEPTSFSARATSLTPKPRAAQATASRVRPLHDLTATRAVAAHPPAEVDPTRDAPPRSQPAKPEAPREGAAPEPSRPVATQTAMPAGKSSSRARSKRKARRASRSREFSRRHRPRTKLPTSPARAAKPATQPTVKRPSAAETPDCSPPTYLGLDGIRRFKKGCL